MMKKDLLIIIPAYNEDKNIAFVIEDLLANYKSADILVINDGSVDGTSRLLAGKEVLVLNHPFNMGIGASFQTGCQFALRHGYDYIARMDADGQHNSAHIDKLLLPLRNNEVDIVVGSRFLGKSDFKSSFFRIIGIKIISAFLLLCTKRKITDPTSGFCAMNKRTYSFFAESCVEDYPEPEILIHHRNFRIIEVPISMKKRANGLSSISNLKSVYYMYKVMLSLFVGLFRKGR